MHIFVKIGGIKGTETLAHIYIVFLSFSQKFSRYARSIAFYFHPQSGDAEVV